jgi:DICT domain-containing protein
MLDGMPGRSILRRRAAGAWSAERDLPALAVEAALQRIEETADVLFGTALELITLSISPAL